MRIRMELLSDAVFGNGVSVPGGEDVSVLCDRDGFPYYKGGTFKGVFREELSRLLSWEENTYGPSEEVLHRLLGKSGNDTRAQGGLIFSDFEISPAVKSRILKDLSGKPEYVRDLFTHIRAFTSIEDGVAKDHSLRTCRCVNKGLYLYSDIECEEQDRALILEVLSQIKWVGTMRNRGFGKIRIKEDGQ